MTIPGITLLQAADRSRGGGITRPVRCATTAPVGASGLVTIDGVTLEAGDKVLRKDEGSAALNGIYVAASGAWQRASDFADPRDVVDGALVHVEAGAANGGTLWRVSAGGASPIVPGTTAVEFEQVSTGGGGGGDIDGDEIEVTATDSVTVRVLADRFAERLNIKDFGAIGDGQVHPLSEFFGSLGAAQAVYPHATSLTQSIDWAAMQAVINVGAARVQAQGNRPGAAFYVPPGRYRPNDELDHSAWPTQVAGYTWIGEGGESSVIQPTSFGRSKYLFKCDHGTVNNRVRNSPGFRFLRIFGNNDVDDPVGVYVPYIGGGTRWIDFDVLSLGNVGVLVYEADNWRWLGGDVARCGTQYVERELGAVYASCAANSDSVRAWSDTAGTVPATGVFNGMVGKRVYIERADGNNQNFEAIVEQSFESGHRATLSAPVPIAINASSQRRISYGVVRGSMGADALNLNLSANVLTADDVGRHVWVRKGGAGTAAARSFLQATIVAVNSASQAVLSDRSIGSLSDEEVFFGGCISIARPMGDRVSANNTNDVHFIGMRIEHHRGFGIMLENVGNFWMTGGKVHGISAGVNDFGQSRFGVILDACNSGAHFEACHITSVAAVDNGTGYILACGNNTKTAFIGCTATNRPVDAYLIDWEVAGNNCELDFGFLHGRNAWGSDPVRIGGQASASDINWWGPHP